MVHRRHYQLSTAANKTTSVRIGCPMRLGFLLFLTAAACFVTASDSETAALKESVVIKDSPANEPLAPSCAEDQHLDGEDTSTNPKLLDTEMAEQRKETGESTARSKVAVIGCGPGGMFFLHALAMKRKMLQDANDEDGLAAMPEVTVYEKASGPGGAWRTNIRNSTRNRSLEMKVGIWANSVSAETEFFDYVYEDFFRDEAIPVYMPRAKLLEYIIARVTSVEDIFQYVQFNTQVTSVMYNNETGHFVVKTNNLETGIAYVDEYDKCVWAGGMQAKPQIPVYLQELLQKGGFQGKLMHSSELEDFESSVVGKRIVLIGDSYSAEDLALQALKLGAEWVNIACLHQTGMASWTSSWPKDRVEILNCLPTEVIHNGTGLLCSVIDSTKTVEGYGYAPLQGGESVELDKVATVVYCTGYSKDMSYLAPDLEMTCRDDSWSVPKAWRSQPNSMEKDLGQVEPSADLHGCLVCDDLYRHALISNPNMFFIYPMSSAFIPYIDAAAFLVAAYVSGNVALPTKEEMETRNMLDKIDEMSVPSCRKVMDDNYHDAHTKLWGTNHWLYTNARHPKYDAYVAETTRHSLKIIARYQQTSWHGGGFGSYDKLSPRGEALLAQYAEEEWSRVIDDTDSKDLDWKTFRDIDPSPFQSLYTGTKAVPLKAHWMDLDDEGEVLVQRKSSASAVA